MFALRLLGNQNKIMFKLNYNAVKIENFAYYFIHGRNGKMYNFQRNNYIVEFISCIYIFCTAYRLFMYCWFMDDDMLFHFKAYDTH